MMLTIRVDAGEGSRNLPIQYQFRMPTSLAFVAAPGAFLSPPAGLHGGTRYMALHGEHSFSDLIWRWLGLPRIDGRGLEVLAGASVARFEGDPSGWYVATGKEWYGEAGFGVGRIPTLLSDLLFLRVDARFGFGPVARGNRGVVVGLSSPF